MSAVLCSTAKLHQPLHGDAVGCSLHVVIHRLDQQSLLGWHRDRLPQCQVHADLHPAVPLLKPPCRFKCGQPPLGCLEPTDHV